MDIGKPLLALMLGFLVWGLYSAVYAVFRRQLSVCYRIGRTFIWGSLLNGCLAYCIVAALIFAVFLLAKTGGVLLFMGLVALLTAAGSSVGLLLAGSLIGMIDGARRPYLAIGAGVALAVLSGISADFGKPLQMLIGAYGLGAIILYLRGAYLDLPAEPAEPATPAEPGSGRFPPEPGSLRERLAADAGSRHRQDLPARQPRTSGAGKFLAAAVCVVLVFFLPRLARLPALNRLDGTPPLERAEAASAPVIGQATPSYTEGEVEETEAALTRDEEEAQLSRSGPAPAPRKTSPPDAAKEQVARMEYPVIALEARMWARRVQGGEFSAVQLRSNADHWITSDEYKADLFSRIEREIKAGPVRPLTKTEWVEYNASKEKVREYLRSESKVD